MIVYNSKLAKLLTFISGFKTIMFMGIILTEKDSLTKKEIKHEDTHCKQYADCFVLGLGISIITMFVLFMFNICNLKLLWLMILPISLFYVLYGIEVLIKIIKYKNLKETYRNISFEVQARNIADTWDKPCEEQNHYYSFGWILK